MGTARMRETAQSTRRPDLRDDRSPRVLHVTESLGRGGAERNLVNMIVATRDDFDHQVLCLYADSDLEAEVREAGVSVEYLRGSRTVWGWVPLIFRIRRRLRAARPDLVHTQLPMADIAGRIAVMLSGGVPVVSTLQTTLYAPETLAREIPNPLLAWTVRRLDSWSVRRTRARLVAVSEEVRRAYGKGLGIDSGQIALIHNSVDLKRLPYRGERPVMELREALGLPSGFFVVVTAARHVAAKGLEYLIGALREPPLAHASVCLVLLGGGPDKSRLARLAEGIPSSHRVVFPGRRGDVPRFLAAADVFALPSLHEGMPLALLEAMAVRTPCVVTDLPHAREAAGDQAAILVPPRDSRSLAEALANLLHDRGRCSRLSVLGRKRVERFFDACANAQAFARELREAIARGPGSGGGRSDR